ncbi:N-acetylglucosamine-6-phosphate deacetylase [Jiangella muralis]|uniref:N-acetylglucosamine-6-phosphate deacetylase n=1 Tax=Jiangella muralis TaxID=702383 RepID=UPI000A71C95A|nr:amidohydrolase family protein [Jiangella muralis]
MTPPSGRLPGLVDLQVNGFSGIDLNRDDLAADDVVALTRELWAAGVTRYLPTLITGSEARLTAAMRAVAAARRAGPLIAHSIAGIHVEGPHISAADGARGAHDPAWIRPPDTAELDRWIAASEGLVRIVTVAPETDGAAAYIAHAVRRGVTVSLGHAAPGAADIRAAAGHGATLSTHLGNGCAPAVPRHPNHLWAQLAEDRLTAMFIADGHHLPADTLTAMIRAKTPARSVLVSDAAPLAGSPPGTYATSVGGRVTVEPGGALRLAGTSLLAGSGASLLDCVRWAAGQLPFDRAALWAMASTTPARLLGGHDASGDSVVVEADGDAWAAARTEVTGTVVHGR